MPERLAKAFPFRQQPLSSWTPQAIRDPGESRTNKNFRFKIIIAKSVNFIYHIPAAPSWIPGSLLPSRSLGTSAKPQDDKRVVNSKEAQTRKSKII